MTDGFMRYVDGHGRLSILRCHKGELSMYVEFEEFTSDAIVESIVQALNARVSPGRQKVGEIAIPPGHREATITAWRDGNGAISLEWTDR